MKLKHFIALLLILAIARTYAQDKARQDFKKLSWLIGKWQRTNSKPGQSGTESWNKISSVKLAGKGITMKDKDTVFIENLELSIKDNQVYYIAKPGKDEPPVFFRLTDISKNSFVCENPQHDFPKKISYLFDGKSLKATISGDGKKTDFYFIRK